MTYQGKGYKSDRKCYGFFLFVFGKIIINHWPQFSATYEQNYEPVVLLIHRATPAPNLDTFTMYFVK